mmetsp:Transcript_11779/g.15296  ORF Transcript_11779/g.15296 Transcript_11779/m.15296 type:complete len:81 (+) Transcript_11779:670-912(+)
MFEPNKETSKGLNRRIFVPSSPADQGLGYGDVHDPHSLRSRGNERRHERPGAAKTPSRGSSPDGSRESRRLKRVKYLLSV